MDRTRRAVTLAGACWMAAGGARAQAVRSRVVTVTRLVKTFLDLESRLLDALERRDAAGLEGLLAEDFEMRLGTRPGAPVPRADWIRAALAADAPDVAGQMIEQMSVHDLGGPCNASFLLRAARRDGTLPPVFVVDTWVPADGSWRLKVRYAVVAAAAPAARITGDAATEVIPKKY